MTQRFRDRVVLVTGGTSGIGRATALAFADAGSANTMLASLRADPHILLAVVNDESGRALAEYRSAGLSAAVSPL